MLRALFLTLAAAEFTKSGLHVIHSQVKEGGDPEQVFEAVKALAHIVKRKKKGWKGAKKALALAAKNYGEDWIMGLGVLSKKDLKDAPELSKEVMDKVLTTEDKVDLEEIRRLKMDEMTPPKMDDKPFYDKPEKRRFFIPTRDDPLIFPIPQERTRGPASRPDHGGGWPPLGGWHHPLGMSDRLVATKECYMFYQQFIIIPNLFEPHVGGWMCMERRQSINRIQDVYVSGGVGGMCEEHLGLAGSAYSNDGKARFNIFQTGLDICDVALMVAGGPMVGGIARATGTTAGNWLARRGAIQTVSKAAISSTARSEFHRVVDTEGGTCGLIANLMEEPFGTMLAAAQLELIGCILGALSGVDVDFSAILDILNKGAELLDQATSWIRQLFPLGNIEDRIQELSSHFDLSLEIPVELDMNDFSASVELTIGLRWDIGDMMTTLFRSMCNDPVIMCHELAESCGMFAIFCEQVSACGLIRAASILSPICNQGMDAFGDLVEDFKIDFESTVRLSTGSMSAALGEDVIWKALKVFRVSSRYDYTHEHQRCVNGHNIALFRDKTVDECKAICNANPECLSFEFGVPHGGPSGNYPAGDCQPQSGAAYQGCDGAYWNLDLYVKGEVSGDCQPQSSAAFQGCVGASWNLDLYVKGGLTGQNTRRMALNGSEPLWTS